MAGEQDKSLVARDIAKQTVVAVNNFVEALEKLTRLEEWRDKFTLSNFNDYQTGNTEGNPEILGENSTYDELKHLDGKLMNDMLKDIAGGDKTVTDSVMHHLVNTVVSGGKYDGETYWAMFQKVRNEL